MKRVRITCKRPPSERSRMNIGVVASFCDLDVLLIDEDGTEHEIDCIESVTWHVATDNEPARATIVLLAEVSGLDALAEFRPSVRR